MSESPMSGVAHAASARAASSPSGRVWPVAAALAAAAWLAATPTHAAPVTGESTQLTLSSAEVTELLDSLGLSISVLAPATLTGLVATFPITGGDTTTDITYSGGLSFSKGGSTVDVADFVANLTDHTISGKVNAGNDVPLFNIQSSGALTFDPALAEALSVNLKIGDLAGASLGTVDLSALDTTSGATTTPVPEPATLPLIALGLAAIGLIKRIRVAARKA